MNIEEKIKVQELLGRYCTFLIGGPADFFWEAKNKEELLAGLEWAIANKRPYFVFGGGSNLLFDDSGFRGLVIRNKSEGFQVNGNEIWAEAGLQMAKLVKVAAEAGLTGLEAWNGLPGTVGGAVYGNAGCFGVECKDVLCTAEIYFPSEEVKTVTVKDLQYGYRDSALKSHGALAGAVVLSATFQLKKGTPGEIKMRMMEIAKSRIQKQPPGSSTGSFFKNPPGDHAGRLIEACGLKGKQVGKAKISEHHANFFLNTGGATAADILTLADHVQKAVEDTFGIRLEREVVFVPATSRL